MISMDETGGDDVKVEGTGSVTLGPLKCGKGL